MNWQVDVSHMSSGMQSVTCRTIFSNHPNHDFSQSSVWLFCSFYQSRSFLVTNYVKSHLQLLRGEFYFLSCSFIFCHAFERCYVVQNLKKCIYFNLLYWITSEVLTKSQQYPGGMHSNAIGGSMTLHYRHIYCQKLYERRSADGSFLVHNTFDCIQ